MCLFIEVLLTGVSSADAGHLTRIARERGLLELRAQRQPRGARGARLSLGQNCACDLAADDADWNAPYYALRSDVADSLVQTLEFLRTRAEHAEMYVRAAWISGAIEPLTMDSSPRASSDLFADATASRLANARVYRVASA